MSMRIISGRFKGLNIAAPKTGTRPTTDRTKEAIFSHLDALGALEGAAVLDLFAGTGALGFEALSRGATSATFVDSAPAAVGLLEKAVAEIRRHPRWKADLTAEVRKAKAEAFVAKLSTGAQDAALHGISARGTDISVSAAATAAAAPSPRYSLVFLDPPYEYSAEDFDALLVALAHSEALADGAIIVAERSTRGAAPTTPQQWESTGEKAYGETKIFYFEA